MSDNAAFEEQLLRLGELDDPLSVFDGYYSHLQHTNADAVTLTRILERATQTFVTDRRYRNDPRYLKLWLAYAHRCVDPEDIYSFLAMRGIASDLAAFYEDYAGYLERKGDLHKAGEVLKAGVQKHAAPIERLMKRQEDFKTKHPESEKKRRQEVAGYNVALLNNCLLSFEEVRAKSWRRAGSILKATYNPPAPIPTMMDDDGLDGFDLGLGPVDPDDLTHVSIYRDNTTDLRELARSLSTEKENTQPLLNFSIDQFILEEKPPKMLLGMDDDDFILNTRRDCRLSLIPEESDIATQVSGAIPSLLSASPRISVADIQHMKERVQVATISSEDLLQPRLAAMEKSIGRDGVGNNHTVASLRVASGHFFVERRLGVKVVLAIDLEADLGGSDLHQAALKLTHDCWEPHILGRLKGIRGIPILGKVCRHPDNIIFTCSYFPHGSLASLLRISIDEKLVLFWVRELVKLLLHLYERNIVHGGITLDHVMVRLGPLPISSIFDPNGGGGWDDRGVGLVSFSHALDGELINLDSELMSETTTNLDSELLPGPIDNLDSGRHIATLDLSMLLNIITEICKEIPTLRYPNMWSELTLFIRQNQGCKWRKLSDVYLNIVSIIDHVLVSESSALPTLKSLLTKLEITLLERHPR
ncbi:Kinase domain containing protein [Paramicrosporidium saccamoebae]|uniref:Kinase domain containing protein n=1 Tax=Paramicrosporidium saccamoebae TaxID=1246581 RepID=A0A2H9TFP9_9FUNG|nr:Kinase domain containing protein [Paramicrosporidium saccamoebae]